MKLYEDDKGNMSLMRIVVLISVLVGSVGFLSGTVSVFLNKEASVTLLTASAGLISVGEWMKMLQKRAENGSNGN